MDRWQALQSFWSSFGWTAYDENSVPDNAELPYITYRASVGSLEDVFNVDASLWERSESWANISRKADQISDYIGSHQSIKIDGGYMYVTRGNPFAQRMDGGDGIRRIYVMTAVEFLHN